MLDLQAVLPAGDPVAAVHLCDVEELGTEPVFVDSLCREKSTEGEPLVLEPGCPLQLITSSVSFPTYVSWQPFSPRHFFVLLTESKHLSTLFCFMLHYVYNINDQQYK